MADLAFSVFLSLLAAFIFLRIAYGVVRDIKKGGRAGWIIGPLGFLLLVGVFGFFAAPLAAIGLLKLSNSFQWPAGYVNGVARTPNGIYIVPLVPAGRIQLYDSQWRFIRGWHVDANAGDFIVKSRPNGTIEAFAARGLYQYYFSESGRLISSQTLSSDPEYYSLHREGMSIVVPTAFLLWVFSSPFLSWGIAAIGGVGLVLVKKRLGMKL
jgi:hypothetical protein